MQSAAVLSLFYPSIFYETMLSKCTAQTQSNSCSFCYSGVFLSLAAVFSLIHPFSLKRNVSVPQNTSCTALAESPDDINPVSLQHASHDPLPACTACLGTPPLLLWLFSSVLLVQGILFLLSYIRLNHFSLDIHT